MRVRTALLTVKRRSGTDLKRAFAGLQIVSSSDPLNPDCTHRRHSVEIGHHRIGAGDAGNETLQPRPWHWLGGDRSGIGAHLPHPGKHVIPRCRVRFSLKPVEQVILTRELVGHY